jgi:hypothetical protein
MRSIKLIMVLVGLALWLYTNFGIIGFGRESILPIYNLAFLLQLITLFVGYLLGLSTGVRDGNKEGWKECLAEVKNFPKD